MTTQQQLIPLCLGERLRQEREKRGIELLDAARKLRIDPPVLQLLEKDELGHLAPVYRRGYIISYARFLEIDGVEIEQMLDSIGNEEPEIHTVFPEAGNPNQADQWLKATSYVLASLLVGTLAWQFTHEAVRLSQKNTGQEVAQVPSASQAADAAPIVQRSAPTHVNASIAALDILRKQRAERQSAGTEAWAALNSGNSVPAETEFLQDGEFMLELTASGDSWVEISDASGRQLEVDIVRGGTTKQYRGTAPFNIQFGRASALSLFLDGQAVDLAPYTIGDVTQMVLDGSSNGRSTEGSEPGSG